jgi:hypothetical protein
MSRRDSGESQQRRPRPMHTPGYRLVHPASPTPALVESPMRLGQRRAQPTALLHGEEPIGGPGERSTLFWHRSLDDVRDPFRQLRAHARTGVAPSGSGVPAGSSSTGTPARAAAPGRCRPYTSLRRRHGCPTTRGRLDGRPTHGCRRVTGSRGPRAAALLARRRGGLERATSSGRRDGQSDGPDTPSTGSFDDRACRKQRALAVMGPV